MNDNQELKDHLTDRPVDYVKPELHTQGDFLCSCGNNVYESTNVTSKYAEYTCGTCKSKYGEYKAEGKTIRASIGVKQANAAASNARYEQATRKLTKPLTTEYSPSKHHNKPQLTIPWPVIMLITGLAIGFIFGVSR